MNLITVTPHPCSVEKKIKNLCGSINRILALHSHIKWSHGICYLFLHLPLNSYCKGCFHAYKLNNLVDLWHINIIMKKCRFQFFVWHSCSLHWKAQHRQEMVAYWWPLGNSQRISVTNKLYTITCYKSCHDCFRQYQLPSL